MSQILGKLIQGAEQLAEGIDSGEIIQDAFFLGLMGPRGDSHSLGGRSHLTHRTAIALPKLIHIGRSHRFWILGVGLYQVLSKGRDITSKKDGGNVDDRKKQIQIPVIFHVFSPFRNKPRKGSSEIFDRYPNRLAQALTHDYEQISFGYLVLFPPFSMFPSILRNEP